MRSNRYLGLAGLWTVVMLASCASAQGVSVTAKVAADLATKNDRHVAAEDLSSVVMWLKPLDRPAPQLPAPAHAGPYRLVQKGKQFIPHLLVVPTGTSVEFPNLDPFFHNVFSLFNGQRFDLGLYEAGSTRSVRFDREGVSYIFCNIHPEMGAIVLALSTPYFAVSDAAGEIVIHNVTPGRYEVSFWSENAPAASLAALKHEITVSSEGAQLGSIVLPVSRSLAQDHKNKFGEDYKPQPAANPY